MFCPLLRLLLLPLLCHLLPVAAVAPAVIAYHVYAALTVESASNRPALLTVPSNVIGSDVLPRRDSMMAELTLPYVKAGFVVEVLKMAETVRIRLPLQLFLFLVLLLLLVLR